MFIILPWKKRIFSYDELRTFPYLNLIKDSFLYGVLLKNILLKALEESNFTSEEKENVENSTKKEENISLDEISKGATESIENENNSDKDTDIPEQINNIPLSSDENSLIKRFLNSGFDGITTNPNYKLLALLVILLINLSLFILIGNLGKTFLRNAGILS